MNCLINTNVGYFDFVSQTKFELHALCLSRYWILFFFLNPKLVHICLRSQRMSNENISIYLCALIYYFFLIWVFQLHIWFFFCFLFFFWGGGQKCVESNKHSYGKILDPIVNSYNLKTVRDNNIRSSESFINCYR